MRKHALITGFFVLGMLASGCQSGSNTLARVGHEAITAKNFQERLAEAPPQYQQYSATPEGRKAFLDILVREKLILQKARRSSVRSNPEYKEQLKTFREQSQKQMAEYQNGLLIQSYLTKLREDDLHVSDEEIRMYYEAHKADFEKPRNLQARHILVASPEHGEAVLAKLKKGSSFESLARNESLDRATAKDGGKVEPFRRGSLPRSFEEGVLALKTGETSGVVQSPFGYHVIRRMSDIPLKPIAFETAAPEIRRLLERDKFEAWVEDTKTDLHVKIDDAALAAVQPERIDARDQEAAP